MNPARRGLLGHSIQGKTRLLNYNKNLAAMSTPTIHELFLPFFLCNILLLLFWFWLFSYVCLLVSLRFPCFRWSLINELGLFFAEFQLNNFPLSYHHIINCMHQIWKQCRCRETMQIPIGMGWSGLRVQAHLECLRVWGEFVNAWRSPSDSPDLHNVVHCVHCTIST